eukprot:5086137-Pyramimonas_sp.AAC.1
MGLQISRVLPPSFRSAPKVDASSKPNGKLFEEFALNSSSPARPKRPRTALVIDDSDEEDAAPVQRQSKLNSPSPVDGLVKISDARGAAPRARRRQVRTYGL